MPKMIIASGSVIVEGNKVLLNKHGDDDFWKFCGGRVEDNEINVREVARREALEEMGISLDIIDEQPYFFYTEKESEAGQVSVVLVHFLAKRIGPVKPGADIRDWAWVDLNSIEQENLAPNIKPALKYFGFIKD